MKFGVFMFLLHWVGVLVFFQGFSIVRVLLLAYCTFLRIFLNSVRRSKAASCAYKHISSLHCAWAAIYSFQLTTMIDDDVFCNYTALRARSFINSNTPYT